MRPGLKRALCATLALAVWLHAATMVVLCLRPASAAPGSFLVEICTAGERTVIDLFAATDEDGTQGGPATTSGMVCPVCTGIGAIVLPEPTVLAAPKVAYVAPEPLAPRVVLPFGGRAPPYVPTGPPAHS